MAIPPISANPDDEPTLAIQINTEWQDLLLGYAYDLFDPERWEYSTEGQKEAILAQVAKLIEVLTP